MIIINIWREGGKLSKKVNHPIIRPLVAAITQSNIGHINFRVEIFPGNTEIVRICNQYALPFEQITTFEREKIKANDNNAIDRYQRGQEKEGIAVTNSFWPRFAPTLKQHKKAILSLTPGVNADFQTQQEDQEAEAEHEVEVLHHVDLRKNINSDNVNGVFKKQIKLKKLEEEEVNLLSNFEKFNTELVDSAEKLESFQKIRNDLLEKYQLLKAEHNSLPEKAEVDDLPMALSKIKEDLTIIENMIIQESTSQRDLNEMIEKIISRLSAITNESAFLNFELNEFYQTRGKDADHTIYFSNEIPIFDEEAILVEMERQRNNEKYAFVTNNCAHSVKKCLLAGLLSQVKKELQEKLGVEDKFFVAKKIEAPSVVMEWLFELQNYLNQLQLNTRATTKTM